MPTNEQAKSIKVPEKVFGRPETTFTLLARERKALKLANLLVFAKITSAEAERASEADWLLAAKAAKCHPPSKETIKIVLQMLRDRETTV
jgi:hypothetical protein